MHCHLENVHTSLMVPSDFALLAYCCNILGYKKTKPDTMPGFQELEYFFSNFTFQYNGNSVETFFSLAIVRAKRKFQHN
jgi:hypothetical protein